MNQGEMSVHEFPISDTLVQQLHTLACTPFEMSAFRQRWQEFGWVYTPNSDDEFWFRVPVVDDPDNLSLQVIPRDQKIDHALLTFCYWERYAPECHDSPEAHQAEERAYHAAYDRVRQQVSRMLGPPRREGEDLPITHEVEHYRHAVWPGETALVILQECGFDMEFGLEINLWLEPCSLSEFTPSQPLIDWLTRRY